MSIFSDEFAGQQKRTEYLIRFRKFILVSRSSYVSPDAIALRRPWRVQQTLLGFLNAPLIVITFRMGLRSLDALIIEWKAYQERNQPRRADARPFCLVSLPFCHSQSKKEKRKIKIRKKKKNYLPLMSCAVAPAIINHKNRLPPLKR